MAQVVANSVLDRNLGAILGLNPALARELAAVEPAEGVEWVETEEVRANGRRVESATYAASGGPSRALASRRGPQAEAERWAGQADLKAHAAFVVRGLGLGYHVQALVKKINGRGTVLVFEPDKRLIRAVLERIDHSSWLGSVHLLTDPADRGAMVEASGRVEPFIAMGTTVLDHPASGARLGADSAAFMERFTSVIAAVRVNLASTLLQTRVTLRNCLQNLDHYATRPGIEPLRGKFKGRTAIVVSAGPSLQRNIDLLSTPGVADRFVIVAVQTVLKPLLARGIRPHFVCALDYHEVSGRFYEGLTAEAVEGVTLVVEPKVNPAVPAAFPGRIRLAGDGFLDALLGDELRRPMGRVTAGTTVAHLCCYFARFLGCDPVCLIGQDLGFTDGQYYSAGAAIHGVWGAELGEFKSLELMEWQRIVRHRSMLRRETDHLGRPVYTDEQMHVYLAQFERDFRADAQAGLTTIDATEGGVRKPHTVSRTLREVVTQELSRPAPARTMKQALDAVEASEERIDTDNRLLLLAARLRTVRQQAWRIGELSRRAGLHLSEATEHHRDQARVNGLIGKLHSLKEEVARQEPGWAFVRMLNQAGSFKRLKADRLLSVSEDLDDLSRQRRQLERDASNVSWLADSADELGGLLEGALSTLGGAARITREPAAELDDETKQPAQTAKVLAVIALESRRAWWGSARDPRMTRVQGRTTLSLTLERLASSRHIDTVLVATDDMGVAQQAAQGGPPGTLDKVRFVQADSPAAWPRRLLHAARALAATSWRGGHNDLTVFDEAFNPSLVARLLREHAPNCGAAIPIGPGWCGVDAALLDQAIERYTENPRQHRLAFVHAAPGFGSALLDRTLIDELATARASGGLWGSLGGVLGYAPVAPAADLLGKPQCVTADPAVRHTLGRATADTPQEAAWLEAALNGAGLSAASASAVSIAAAINEHARRSKAVTHVVIDLAVPGLRFADALRDMGALSDGMPGSTITLRDPHLRSPMLRELVSHARKAHPTAVLHVRTDLCGGAEQISDLLALDPDIVSVDCHADTPPTYAALTGRAPEVFTRLRSNLEALMDRRIAVEGVLKLPLVVPRITKRDEVYTELEDWYDRHLLACGWAAIDPLDVSLHGHRIAPLPLPPLATERLALATHRTGVGS